MLNILNWVQIMKVKFLDTVTGEEGWTNYPFSVWWWAEGNGSCDCNRSGSAFDKEHPCTTDSSYRFIAVDLEDHPDKTIAEQLDEYNEDLDDNYKIYTKAEILEVINGHP